MTLVKPRHSMRGSASGRVTSACSPSSPTKAANRERIMHHQQDHLRSPGQAVRRGVFKSAPDLKAKARTYIEGWNKRAHPFVLTKPAEEILKKANRSTTSNLRH